VPVGFSPLSVTFVSASQGWVLGGAPCGDGSVRCAVIVRTADGGHTWTRTPAPATTVGQATGAWRDGASGVGGIRFADANDGWLFGPELWITHDGGATWQSQAVPGGSDSQVMTLEAHAGLVHAVVTDGDATHGFQVASSPVADDTWALAATSLRFGAGPVPTVQLVLSGTAGWIVEVDRDVTGGLRLGAGVWQAWRPPCSGANGAAVLAAYSASQLVAACDEGVWGPAPSGAAAGERLYMSSDGGTTFTRGAATIPLGSVQQLAQPTATTVVASGAQAVRSTDGGATWRTVLADSPGKEGTIYLGFTTASQGVLITGGRLGPNGLLMSYDGGRTWRPVTF
jgi:hypothetical protein